MRPDSFVTFDDSRWPLRIVRFVGPPTTWQYELYLQQAEASLKRRERHLSITDMTRAALPTPELRQRQILWMQKHEGLIREVILGAAFVVPTPLLRLSLNTVLHFKPLPVPYLIATQEVEAVGWASILIEERGLRRVAERLRSQYGLPTRLYA